MAPPPLRVGATVDDSRVTITFSQRACAQKYYDYLETLGDRFNDIQPCGHYPPLNTVFINVPSEIIINPAPPDDPNGITLTFEDEAEARAWEQELILWERTGQGGNNATAKIQLRLVTVWKVDVFYSKLRCPKVNGDDKQGTVYAVMAPSPSAESKQVNLLRKP